jgi:hypothetical protein
MDKHKKRHWSCPLRNGKGLRLSLIGALILTLFLGGILPNSSTSDIASDAPYLQDNFVPVGYEDTKEDGGLAATDDIKNNKMMFGKYGAIEGLNYSKYLNMGVTPILLGCGVGGSGFTFWMAYNKTIIKEMQRRGYEFDVGGPI